MLNFADASGNLYDLSIVKYITTYWGPPTVWFQLWTAPGGDMIYQSAMSYATTADAIAAAQALLTSTVTMPLCSPRQQMVKV